VPSPEKTISAYWREKQEVADAKIDESNPSYMYERDKDEEEATTTGVLWYDGEDFTTVEIQHLAEAPVDTHIYSTKEMREFSSTKENKHYEQSMSKKNFKHIINAAYSLERFLETSSGNEAYPRPPHLHDVLEKDSSAQDLVNICCLVDRGREFAVDTLFVQKRKTKFSLRIDSYLLETNRTLKSYANSRSKKKDPPNVPVFMEVYCSWLKKYLDWFDPDLFIYVLAHSDGMTVERIQNQLASEDPVDYQMSGVKDVDPLMVPIPKMREIINTGTYSFGITVEGKSTPYCKNTFTTIPEFSQDVVQPLYDKELTKSCNPPGFEEVPVARMPTAKVPLAHMQITGIRADAKVEGGETTLRWLGLQDEKYVSLPSEWVEMNFDGELLPKAKQCAERVRLGEGALGRFLILPVGDSPNDNPPVAIQDNLGLNYYYQGNVDNCVMGGLVNAVYWMMGPDKSDLLLRDFLPAVIEQLWQKFVMHVNFVLRGDYWMKRLEDDFSNT
jgi:hypothetical protein